MRDTPPRGRPVMGCTAALLVVLGLLLPAERAAATGERTVEVSVDPQRKGPLVARRFVGLSFEAAALPAMARNSRRGNLVTLLRSLGPGLLRFGGFTADTNTAFSARGEGPAWATTTITPRDLDRLRALALRTGWRVLLTLPLGHYDPKAAAREAGAAARRLGDALAAFEIGNEPNAFWLIGLRAESYSYDQYRTEIRAYRRAIDARAPGVPIAGPDIVPQLAGPLWMYAFARDERPALLTPHYYALNACTQSSLTVADLSSPSVLITEARTISTFSAIGRDHRIPVRLGETNNVACAGRAGVSDTFGAALWALRYMLTLARSGIAGVNFHTLPDTCGSYSAICAQTRSDYRRGRLRAMPEWYALLLFRHLVGARLTRMSLSHHQPGLTVAAFQQKRLGRIDVVAVNTTPGAEAPLAIRLAGRDEFRSGSVLRLAAPALEAKDGVRLGGAGVTRRGAWRPSPRFRRIRREGGEIRVAVPGASAVLIRLER
jgi:hypothetical protein